MANSRKAKTSVEQLKILVDELEMNKKFRKNQFDDAIESKRHWVRLTNRLNSCGTGPTLNYREWKSRVRSWKNYLRRSAKHQITGSGRPRISSLTALEERALELFGKINTAPVTQQLQQFKRRERESSHDSDSLSSLSFTTNPTEKNNTNTNFIDTNSTSADINCNDETENFIIPKNEELDRISVDNVDIFAEPTKRCSTRSNTNNNIENLGKAKNSQHKQNSNYDESSSIITNQSIDTFKYAMEQNSKSINKLIGVVETAIDKYVQIENKKLEYLKKKCLLKTRQLDILEKRTSN